MTPTHILGITVYFIGAVIILGIGDIICEAILNRQTADRKRAKVHYLR